MTLLQLVQRACREASITGTGPTTVTGQIGMQSRMVNWVISAISDIEIARSDWGWLYQSFSFPTVAGVSEYSPLSAGITDGDDIEWGVVEVRNYVTAVGTNSEIFMDVMPYNEWRDNYLYGALRVIRTRPIQFAISPTQQIALGPVPDATYTVTGKYYLSPQVIDPEAVGADLVVPRMPLKFQMMIVWRALAHYGEYMSAVEAQARGEKEFKKMMRRMESKYLQDVSF